MIARREIFLCDNYVRPQVDPFGYQRTPVGSICGPMAELGRRSCGADVAGWLNATVPLGLVVTEFGCGEGAGGIGRRGCRFHVLSGQDLDLGLTSNCREIGAVRNVGHEPMTNDDPRL
jgi:hypothetical protein